MQILKRGVAVKVHIGQFVDVTDGFTPETTVALGAADEAELLKHDSTATVDISGRTWGAIGSVDGWYALSLTTADTDTPGALTVIVQDDSLCLPVHARFQVMAANPWDSFHTTDASFPELPAQRVNAARAWKSPGFAPGRASGRRSVESYPIRLRCGMSCVAASGDNWSSTPTLVGDAI